MPLRTSVPVCAGEEFTALNVHKMATVGKALTPKCTEVLVFTGDLAPRVGIEPTTNGLTVRCSTAELPGNWQDARRARILAKGVIGVKESCPVRPSPEPRALPSS